MNNAALNVYRALRRDGTQKAVVDSMQTRMDLYDCRATMRTRAGSTPSFPGHGMTRNARITARTRTSDLLRPWSSPRRCITGSTANDRGPEDQKFIPPALRK